MFLHDDEYFEYLLENLWYLSEKMFIIKRIKKCEIGPNVD
jgi:hypothetical protein